METLRDNAGKSRAAVKVCCEHCTKEFLKPKRFFKLGYKNYCSNECKYAQRKLDNRVETSCGQCGKPLLVTKRRVNSSKSGLVFCDKTCKDRAQAIEGGRDELNPAHYGTASSRYREVAKVSEADGCSRCGYNKVLQILEVHHKDSDRSNNSVENLEILCPNCHVEEHFLTKTGRYAPKKIGALV